MQFQLNFNSILLNSGSIKGNFRILYWIQIQLNLIQIQLKRNGVQIGIESTENLLIIMVLKKENFLKNTNSKRHVFIPPLRN
jgi:hypothetical protein